MLKLINGSTNCQYIRHDNYLLLHKIWSCAQHNFLSEGSKVNYENKDQ